MSIKPSNTLQNAPRQPHDDHCQPAAGKPDFLLWGSLLAIAIGYVHFG
jgi:hypothetical protein